MNDLYYSMSRQDVLKIVPNKPERALELGCGNGLFGESLKNKFGAYVVGVERNPEAARAAATRLDRAICADIDDVSFLAEFGPEFDLIAANDLLEHLVDPWKIVREIRTKLTDDGYVIASIPNVRVVSRRLALKGAWDYQDAGVLDRTHLRFFTKRTMTDMFSQAGFQIVDVVGLLEPVTFTEKFYMKYFEEFRQPQYCVIARK